MLQAYLVQWAWVIPGHGVDCGMQDPVGSGMWGAGADTLGWVALLQEALEAPGPGGEVRHLSVSVTSAVKCLPHLLIPFELTRMTGYSGQEKIELTSCDSGKVNHIGTWPLNTQGAGSNLRGWLGAPLSSLVISWLLSWTSCPSFSDKLCLKEWWAVCH